MIRYICNNCDQLICESSVCPVCKNRTYIDKSEIYYCNKCNIPLFDKMCPICSCEAKYIGTDIRPVFPEERLLLEVIEGEPFKYVNKSIWNTTGNNYFIDGEKVKLTIKNIVENIDANEVRKIIKENKDENKIYVTGNTAIDAMDTTVDDNYTHPELEWIKPGERMILLTAHRRENLGDPMRHIFKAIRRIVDEFNDVKVIYPIHMNPRVREVAKEIFTDCDKVKLIEPLEVFDFHNFQNKSYIILTDSGGIQEEAPSLGKPVLVLRDTTERPEGIEAGTLKLVGTDEETIYNETKKLLTAEKEYEKMSHASNPYGDGLASKRIVDAIIERFKAKCELN